MKGRARAVTFPRGGARLAIGARGAVLVFSLALVAAGCAEVRPSASPSAVPQASSPTVPTTWRACGGGLECAGLMVPLDYARPNEQMIRIYLARLPASDPGHRIGSLVLNYGGPGAPGALSLQRGAATMLPASLLARFDIVSFDPRGSGSSSPVTCVDDATMDRMRALEPVPRTATEREAILESARGYAAGCQDQTGALLPYISTEAIARDLDRIRAALGEEQLTYLGYSYGTYLGARYATLFPGRVRALVLDAAIDITADPITIREDNLLAYESALDRFLADCATRPDCAFHAGGDPGAAFDALMAQIESAPIPAGGSRPLGLGDARTAVMAALRGAAWPDLAIALGAADRGDGSLLLTFADQAMGRNTYGQYDNSLAAGTATTCMDAPGIPDLAAIEALEARLAKDAPRLGGSSAVFSGIWAPCMSWPVRPSGSPALLVAPPGTPILVVGGTGDPATPYAWSQRMATSLGNAILVTRRGEGHTTMVDPANPCLVDVIARYLIDLEVPGDGLTC
jgi:pimeloyl-ACP methyl ester carboxylesterase